MVTLESLAGGNHIWLLLTELQMKTATKLNKLLAHSVHLQVNSLTSSIIYKLIML